MSQSQPAIQTAIAHLNANQPEQAKVVLRRVLQRNAADAEANKLLGMLHSGLDENDQALFYLKRAVSASGKDPMLRFMLGNLLMIMKKDAEAVAAYRVCTELAPGHFEGYDGMAKCLLRMGKHDEAVKAYEKGIAATPDDPASYRMYALALSTMGRVPEGLAVLRRGMARLPRDAGLRESLCYQSNFGDEADAARVFEEHAALGRLVQEQSVARAAVLKNAPDPERKLRIGFVSGDFCSHACALFMEGPLRELDRSRYELFCYYTREVVEPTTVRFQQMSQWRACHEMSDEQLAARVVEDGIDVLVDTAGWTELHKLRAFVPRAAPVQVTWLGYPNTTGIPTMDYRVVDAITDPPGSEGLCTEKLMRLPGCFVSFEPLKTSPEVNVREGLPITFGSFNRLSKVRPAVARTWAKVLARVPESRLLLKTSLVSDDVKAEYNREFAAEGVSPDRVEWSGFVSGLENHLAMYHHVDIALDSFPYNGTTTTCEATWMGVPVVTLEGEVHRSRVGASLLTALGLTGQIARSTEEYVQVAVGLAEDRAKLREMRMTLRGRMAASPLCDAEGFARTFESAVRGAWAEWCRGQVGGGAEA